MFLSCFTVFLSNGQQGELELVQTTYQQTNGRVASPMTADWAKSSDVGTSLRVNRDYQFAEEVSFENLI